MCIEVIGDIRNLPFYRRVTDQDLKEHQKFLEVVNLMIQLHSDRLLEFQQASASKKLPRSSPSLVFAQPGTQAEQMQINQLKRLLGLSARIDRFQITSQLTRVEHNEITLRMRSMVSLMGLMAKSIPIPDEHLADGRARRPAGKKQMSTRLQVEHGTERPDDAFVTVHYGGYWFYIHHGELETKEAFGLISYLFQMQAPQAPAVPPIITVPAG